MHTTKEILERMEIKLRKGEEPPLSLTKESMLDSCRKTLALRLTEMGWPPQCQIPKRYLRKRLENLTAQSVEASRALTALSQGKSLLISGPCGVGKTHLACALGWEWLIQNIPTTNENAEIVRCSDGYASKLNFAASPSKWPQFLSAVEFFFAIKRCYGTDEDENEVLEKLRARSLLILDDLGAERVNEWSLQLLYLLLDRRYRDEKQTIITSNLTLAEIAELDDRIASRIAEMGEVVNLGGPDRRVTQTKES